MDKNTFMRELERSLSVLQESELRDILSEYEQHIDMKVKSGLSEEEAHCGFWKYSGADGGDPGGLPCTGRFRPGTKGRRRLESSGRRPKTMGTDPAKARETEKKNTGRRLKRGRPGRPGLEKKAAGFFSELGRRAVKLARRAGRWGSDVFVFWRELLERPFRRFSRFWKQRREEQLYLTDGSMEMENAGKEKRKRRSIFGKDRRFLWAQAGRYGKTVL